MKKKIRHIVVDGHKFVWRILDKDESSKLLRIWIEGQKRIPWLDVIYPYRNPWLNLADAVAASNSLFLGDDPDLFEGITPLKVSNVLKSAIQKFEITDNVTSTFKAYWELKNMQLNEKYIKTN
jgi:hypothetical protein